MNCLITPSFRTYLCKAKKNPFRRPVCSLDFLPCCAQTRCLGEKNKRWSTQQLAWNSNDLESKVRKHSSDSHRKCPRCSRSRGFSRVNIISKNVSWRSMKRSRKRYASLKRLGKSTKKVSSWNSQKFSAFYEWNMLSWHDDMSWYWVHFQWP